MPRPGTGEIGEARIPEHCREGFASEGPPGTAPRRTETKENEMHGFVEQEVLRPHEEEIRREAAKQRPATMAQEKGVSWK
jgi:hypothetical protein